MSQEQSKPSGKETTHPFEGETREHNDGGNCADGAGEKHDSPKAQGKRSGQDANISKCLNDAKSPALADSQVSGTRREIGPAEQIRRANNHYRDSRSNLGKGKPSSVVTE
jgi:hypothetical protein